MLQGCEVPLHFACKHGFAEVVAVLISHPKTDKSVRNKYNETPKEVRKDKTCRRPKLSLRLELT